MIPTTRTEFLQFCLRKLGAPVIQVNVSEEQADDILDQAIYYFQEWHMDGNDTVYYKYTMTATDVTNGYVTLPSSIIGVRNIFPIGQAINTNSMFNMRYQFVLNDLYNLANVSIIPYFMVMTHLSLLEEMLVGQKPIRFSRHTNTLYLDFDVQMDAPAGTVLLIQCYGIIDGSDYPSIWGDRWLQDYTVALLKKQWGQNLRKFKVVLPSGITIDGQAIYQEAVAEIAELEEKMKNTYSIPAFVYIA